MAYYSPYNNRLVRIAIGGCPHTKADSDSGRDSITTFLTTAINGFNPSLLFINGDLFSASNPLPSSGTSTEGGIISTQLNSQGTAVRHKIYTIPGNHDSGDQNYFMYDKYVDDFGDNTADSGVTNSSRPYTIVEINKATHRYAIRVGNMTFIFMGDNNDNPSPTGRSAQTGGRPSGALYQSDFNWWSAFVASEYAAGQNVITNTHMALCRETTIGTGPAPEGGHFHGTDANLDLLACVGYLITDRATNAYIEYQDDFIDWMAANPNKNLASFFAHTHYDVGQTDNGRGWTYSANGCTFVNTGGLTEFHEPADIQYCALVLEPGSTTAKIYKIHQYDTTSKMRFNSTYVLTVTLNFAFQP